MKVLSEAILSAGCSRKAAAYSYHAFLFPFEWKCRHDKEDLFEKKTSISLFVDWLKGSPDWKPKKFQKEGELQAKTLAEYNEMAYFHDFVHHALYDDGSETSFLRHYEYALAYPAKYCIYVSGRSEPYELEIDAVLLHVYSTGVGVLSFHLSNRLQSQSSPGDILRINQFGRRIYPPFFGLPEDLFGRPEMFLYDNWREGLRLAKSLELPEELRIKTASGFIAQKFDDDLPPKRGVLPPLIRGLLPPKLLEKVEISPVLDDRMFVLCWYGNPEVMRVLQGKALRRELRYPYEYSNWWYSFIFVDKDSNGPGCSNESMLEQLISEHTNARWVESGTLYGASRYSFVMLTGELNFLLPHWQTMYYKLAELCLVQRACLLRFSDEITEISRLSTGDKSLAQKVNSLYRSYIQFVNKIYFREVTPQEQGIELYGMLQNHMRLEKDVKELSREMQELNQYVMQVEEEKRNRHLQQLTILATIFLIPTFITGFLGMNVFDKIQTSVGGGYALTLEHWFLYIFLGGLASIAVALAGIFIENRYFKILFLVLSAGILVGVLYFLSTQMIL